MSDGLGGPFHDERVRPVSVDRRGSADAIIPDNCGDARDVLPEGRGIAQARVEQALLLLRGTRRGGDQPDAGDPGIGADLRQVGVQDAQPALHVRARLGKAERAAVVGPVLEEESQRELLGDESGAAQLEGDPSPRTAAA